MLGARQRIHRILSLDHAFKLLRQSLPNTNAQIQPRSRRGSEDISCERVLEVKRWQNSLCKSMILLISLQNAIDLTETNTQSNSILALRLPVDIRASRMKRAEIIIGRSNRADKGDEVLTTRLKVSPTRIRFSNVKSILNNRIYVQDTGRSSREPDEKADTTVSFSNLKSRTAGQMAPAYELWPDLQGNKNQVTLGENKIPKKHERNFMSSPNDENGRNLSGQFKLNSMRNLLPKPVAGNFLFGSSQRRHVRIRSVSSPRLAESDNGVTKAQAGKVEPEVGDGEGEEEVEEVADQTGAEGPNSDGSLTSNEVDSSSARDSEADSSADEDKPQQGGSNVPNINFKLPDKEQNVAVAESKESSKSPVYPPGDLDRLYSDALLIYVKDFNQYIRE